MKPVKQGFTLIELLIVVAIIAILAAIAVPNFLEAQTRAKISRGKADMRSLTTGIETYHIDYGTYLYCNVPGFAIKSPVGRVNHRKMFERLTTPVAYLNSVFIDPFPAAKFWRNDWNQANPFANENDKFVSQYYWYTSRNNAITGANTRWDQVDPGESKDKPTWYLIEQSGPDLTRHQMTNALNDFAPADVRFQAAMYDATNGTVSRGSIWRAGGAPGREQDKTFYQLVQGQY